MNDPYATQRGSIIRRVRKSRDMTLVGLSEKTDLSLSFISQVERGITNPSLNSLRKIAIALDIPLSSFFEEGSSNNGPVVRKNERRILINNNSRLTYQLLSRDPNRNIELLLTRLEVGCTSAESPMIHKGEEAALVLQGECKVELGHDKYDVKNGDSFYINENTPHKFTNTGNVPLVIVSAISPPGF
jgi:transcriptional regulator with XRE-family HTH domain